MQTLTSGVSACDSPIMSDSSANVSPLPHRGRLGLAQLGYVTTAR